MHCEEPFGSTGQAAQVGPQAAGSWSSAHVFPQRWAPCLQTNPQLVPSHVAIPFPMTDPVYGRDEVLPHPDTIRLGLLSPRGERAVLTVPSDTLMRLTCNPFFSYLDDRMAAWVGEARDVALQRK